jgi:hypothetical protein
MLGQVFHANDRLLVLLLHDATRSSPALPPDRP